MDTEILKAKVSQIEDEIFKIYNIVSSEKEISLYKNYLLTFKLGILEGALEKVLVMILNNETYRLINLLKLRKFIILSLIISCIILFFNPLLGLSILALNWICYMKWNTECIMATKDADSINNYIMNTNDIKIMLQNCRVFLRKHTNSDLGYREEELKNKDLGSVQIDNSFIDMKVVNDSLVQLPDDVKNSMINLFKSELQTEEDNLEVLVKMALNQNDKKVENNNILTRIRKKK